MTDGNTYAIDRYLDEREDWDTLQEAEIYIDELEARIEELEAKLAVGWTEVIAQIREDAEIGNICDSAALWVIDTITDRTRR